MEALISRARIRGEVDMKALVLLLLEGDHGGDGEGMC